ncbi:MAG: hypothetical protein ACON47_04665 [Flavobacteriaceae bacterium]
MICICAALPERPFSGLVINRKEQQKLALLIQEVTGMMPFIFNSQSGLYVFCAARKTEEALLERIELFIRSTATSFHWVQAGDTPHFFSTVVRQALNHPNGSSLGWKNFISSFLIQLDPFDGKVLPVFSLFKNFVAVVKVTGTPSQLDYLKKKMNSLRTRVNVDALFYESGSEEI